MTDSGVGPFRPRSTRAARSHCLHSGHDDLARLALLAPHAEDGITLSRAAWARIAALVKVFALVGDLYG